MDKKDKTTTGNDENNKIAAEAHKRKQQDFEKFIFNFEKEYKLIKKLTHECQFRCFNTEKSSAKEADFCAKICLRPYMMLRDLNGQKFENCGQNFKFNESKCLTSSKNSDSLTECYRLVISQHEECLKTMVPVVQKNYRDTIKDFDKFSKNEM